MKAESYLHPSSLVLVTTLSVVMQARRSASTSGAERLNGMTTIGVVTSKS